jgi:hypothetical protein
MHTLAVLCKFKLSGSLRIIEVFHLSASIALLLRFNAAHCAKSTCFAVVCAYEFAGLRVTFTMQSYLHAAVLLHLRLLRVCIRPLLYYIIILEQPSHN